MSADVDALVTGPAPEPAAIPAPAPDHVSQLFGRDALYVALWAVQLLGAAGLTPLITRLMAASEYGAASTANAVMQVLFVVAGLGLQTAIQRRYAGQDGPAAARRLLTLTIVLAAAVTAVADGTGRWWHGLVGFGHYDGALRAAVLWAGIAAVTAAALALLRCQDRLLAFSAVSLIQSVVAEAASLLLVAHAGATASNFLLGQAAAQAAATALALVLVPPRRLRAGDRALARDSLAYALPLVPAVLATFVLTSADRFVVGADLGQHEVARYQIAYNVGSAPTLLLSVLNTAWMPRFFGLTDPVERASALARSRDGLYRLLPPVMIGLAVGAPLVLRLWAPASYRTDGLTLTTAVVIVSAVPFTAGLAATRTLLTTGRTASIAAASLVAAVVNVLANLVLVPPFGLTGSAAATAGSYGLMHLVLRVRADAGLRLPGTDPVQMAGLGGSVALALACSLLPAGLMPAPVRLLVAAGCVGWFGRLLAGLAGGRVAGGKAAVRSWKPARGSAGRAAAPAAARTRGAPPRR